MRQNTKIISYPAIKLCLENIVCFLHLLHIFKHTLDFFNQGSKQNEP